MKKGLCKASFSRSTLTSSVVMDGRLEVGRSRRGRKMSLREKNKNRAGLLSLAVYLFFWSESERKMEAGNAEVNEKRWEEADGSIGLL